MKHIDVNAIKKLALGIPVQDWNTREITISELIHNYCFDDSEKYEFANICTAQLDNIELIIIGCCDYDQEYELSTYRWTILYNNTYVASYSVQKWDSGKTIYGLLTEENRWVWTLYSKIRSFNK